MISLGHARDITCKGPHLNLSCDMMGTQLVYPPGHKTSSGEIISTRIE